ncbi:MAG: iron-containing alcohol dehydrogenase [Gammaproteobacteria bacterium]|nr:iron-containing alcohol dehydrogenase [Gammaproteobacteria bacterium]NIR97864.1 iron-containing alcohol dehydrogenase [Gammaproteobacteria bacterium]NIT63569.1 iron-containing alcohol dehydrogenase [Gammaproteobacteria bacterium]NIV20505.1 iron-containing alcohol dehydrogenase [Gammaproteobacteria bacterium]NIX11099.1 iron-containing alcohol dehydrogenase [Gammaproteobacteria bacterium]
MVIAPFSIARLPRIEFGSERRAWVPALAAGFGSRMLLITGAGSMEAGPYWVELLQALEDRGLAWERLTIADEPSPELVDAAVARYRSAGVELVVGIGGGSVLDGAKAIAGLLPTGRSVMDHLEGVGPELPYEGPPLPFIAVPTTAGTGSEATKNAVLSRRGEGGFKKSFRHASLVPDVAVVDPDLLVTCPKGLIAANGMDALTQLIESYVSLRANPLTDALALSGLEAARDSLLPWFEAGEDAPAARTGMAYASLLSGITLAQTGLGSVHGLASPLGAFFPIPHGAVCGTLAAAATQVNIQAMIAREPDNPALEKYARLGELLAGRRLGDRESARRALIQTLHAWTERMGLERLSAYGVKEGDLGRIANNSHGSSMKTNPIVLTDGEITQIVKMRL